LANEQAAKSRFDFKTARGEIPGGFFAAVLHHENPHIESTSEDQPNAKMLHSNDEKPAIKVPRDRNGDFQPTLIPKHRRKPLNKHLCF